MTLDSPPLMMNDICRWMVLYCVHHDKEPDFESIEVWASISIANSPLAVENDLKEVQSRLSHFTTDTIKQTFKIWYDEKLRAVTQKLKLRLAFAERYIHEEGSTVMRQAPRLPPVDEDEMWFASTFFVLADYKPWICAEFNKFANLKNSLVLLRGPDGYLAIFKYLRSGISSKNRGGRAIYAILKRLVDNAVGLKTWQPTCRNADSGSQRDVDLSSTLQFEGDDSTCAFSLMDVTNVCDDNPRTRVASLEAELIDACVERETLHGQLAHLSRQQDILLDELNRLELQFWDLKNLVNVDPIMYKYVIYLLK
jgi:hypothetical protein